MIGFEDFQLGEWLVDGIFTSAGKSRGRVAAVQATVSRVVCGVAVAAAVVVGTASFATAGTVLRPATFATVAIEESELVDPSVWGPLIARLKAARVVEESNVDEPPMTV